MSEMLRSAYHTATESFGTLTAYEDIPAGRFVAMVSGLDVEAVKLCDGGLVSQWYVIGVSDVSVATGGVVPITYEGVAIVEATEDFINGGWAKAGDRVTSAQDGMVRKLADNDDCQLGIALTSASATGNKIAVLLQRTKHRG